MEQASTPVTDLLKKLLKKLLLGIVAVGIAIPTLRIMFSLPNELQHSDCDAILTFLYPTPQAQQADYQHCFANTDTRITRPLPVMAVALCIGLAVVWFICSFVLSRQAQRDSMQKMRVFLSVMFFGLGLASYIYGFMAFETTTVFVLPIASWILLLGIGIFVIVPSATSSVKRRSQPAINLTTPVTLAASSTQRLEYIPLPSLAEIHFVSSSTSLLKVVMPDEVRNYAVRLLTRELEKYADRGWILDKFEFKPWEPVIEPVERWRLLIPFTAVRFRCIGVKIHLRRR